MSQIVLDDQLFPLDVLVPIARWSTVQRLRDVRPGEVIKDERVPVYDDCCECPLFAAKRSAWAKSFRSLRSSYAIGNTTTISFTYTNGNNTRRSGGLLVKDVLMLAGESD